MLYKIQSKIASLIGDTWISSDMVALWFWPAVVMGAYTSKTHGNDYRLFAATIQPGDMIVTTQSKYKGSNSAIPGAFKHLMVYTGPVKGEFNGHEIKNPISCGIDYKYDFNKYEKGVFQRTVTHAESDGIGTFDLLDIFFHYDYLCVVRPWKTKEQQEIIVNTALAQVGKPYDFGFDSEGVESLYCTELGSYCLEMSKIDTPESIQKMTKFWKPWKKNKVFIADGFVEKYDIVCKTVSCNDASIFKGTFADRIKDKVFGAKGRKDIKKKTLSERFSNVPDAGNT